MSKTKASLADIMPLLLADLPAALTTTESLPALQKTAIHLAPILRGGFECRLGAVPQIDLQQCIAADDRQVALLHAYLTEIIAKDDSANPMWTRLLTFVSEWQESSSFLRSTISEIWLEFDAEPEMAATQPTVTPLPAFFFGLPQNASASVDSIAASENVLDQLLGREHWSALQHNLHRCFDACPEEAFVSHIGVMLSRSTEALRINIKRLQPDTVIAYLQQVDWPGDADELAKLMDVLDGHVDRITLCLDVGRTLSPRVGLECILLKQPPEEARWGSLLAHLVEQGLCLPEKASALLRWPGRTTPLTTTVDWPDRLICTSLQQSPDHFTSIVRRLSHIKVVYQPTAPLEAKGYLWFSHEWQQPALAEPALAEPQTTTTDLDAFYSQETIDEWKQIIGEDLHYHFGYFQGNEDLETGLRQTVRNFYPHIPLGSRLLDIGCGWGGPARLLAKEQQCVVQGVSISHAQVAYCQSLGLDVWHADIEVDRVSGVYDVIFMLEVLSHIRDKRAVLKKLRSLAPRLIISMSCMSDMIETPRTVFGSSMALVTESEFIQAVEEAGWRIQVLRNRRFQSLRTALHWQQNLARCYDDHVPPGQLGVLQNLAETVLQSPIRWCQSFPLIDIVAEA